MSFIKKNKITIISILIMLIWGIYEIFNCYKEGIICNDPIIIYFHLTNNLSLFYFQLLAPLFIFIPAIWNFHNELNSGYIKNCLTRINYKKYLKKHYLKALSKSLILPLFVIFLFLASCLLTGGFDFGSGGELYDLILSLPDSKFISNVSLFMLTYLINMLLHSILYVNLGLLYCRKYSNILVNIILSYLSFIILAIIMEVFVGNLLLSVVLNIKNVTDSLNLFNIWVYSNTISLSFAIIYSFCLVLISTIIVYLIYKNKEGVIIEIEK